MVLLLGLAGSSLSALASQDITINGELLPGKSVALLAACRTFLWFSAMIAACPQRDPA
jgi:hypothetical protein